MKKRYLRKSIQRIMEVITIALFIFFGSLYDFEVSLKTISILFALLSLLVFNSFILSKYGKYTD